MLKIAIASDHGGFDLKEEIINKYKNESKIKFIDCGTHSKESVDYPDYAQKVVQKIIEKKAELGILCCGTGIGMSIKANRHRQIRAAVAHNEKTAHFCKAHNNANILCLGERVITKETALLSVKTWLETPFEGDRHKKRIEKL